ncbi:IclR family transcriptional regulator [Bradyrhizobium sp. CB82]|uniref:IclR family transcriptional regulator n=1 Tax=Bradyrhizobium sp. CB82 TaxID=3039159 RepID=UPI0024B2221D|nr:IclR family transcriptional regulator [Bradyrhizobium sp. CB82]WFU41594.1 IclR family transcriptional regulator [Bradyrhizobium sp. CB82]
MRYDLLDREVDETGLERLAASKKGAAPAERQNGIDRTIDLLEALLHLRAPSKLGDLAKEMGAPRSTVYAIANRLIEADILENVGEGGQIYFGKAVHLYGRAYADANPLHRRCREALEKLATEHNATAQLCALRGNKYVVVDTQDGSGLFRITTDVGVEVPLPWTASGRLLLDHMSPDEIRAFIPREDFQLPDGRRLDVNDFIKDVARAKRDGKCTTTALSDRFTSCLAAPIRDRQGVAVATLCFVIPADSPKERKTALLDELVTTARELSDHP